MPDIVNFRPAEPINIAIRQLKNIIPERIQEIDEALEIFHENALKITPNLAENIVENIDDNLTRIRKELSVIQEHLDVIENLIKTP